MLWIVKLDNKFVNCFGMSVLFEDEPLLYETEELARSTIREIKINWPEEMMDKKFKVMKFNTAK